MPNQSHCLADGPAERRAALSVCSELDLDVSLAIVVLAFLDHVFSTNTDLSTNASLRCR